MIDAASPRPGVGSFIALVRARRGMSQRALSRLVGRSPAYLSKLEAGHLDPALSAFGAIAVGLDLNPMEVWVLVRWAAHNCPTDVTSYSGCSPVKGGGGHPVPAESPEDVVELLTPGAVQDD